MAADFGAVGRLLAPPARSAALGALMEGRPLAAGELARIAGVRASTMSEHLAALVDGGLLAVVAAGRHRYYRLAGEGVSGALEALAGICPPPPVRTLRQSVAARSLRLSRLCYDHLAGVLGVALLEQMLAQGWLADVSTVDLEVSRAGARALTALGVDVGGCRQARRHFARPCLDWSERRPHLAGAVGAGLATALLDLGWVRRRDTGRGLRITERGSTGLQEVFHLDVAPLAAIGGE